MRHTLFHAYGGAERCPKQAVQASTRTILLFHGLKSPLLRGVIIDPLTTFHIAKYP